MSEHLAAENDDLRYDDGLYFLYLCINGLQPEIAASFVQLGRAIPSTEYVLYRIHELRERKVRTESTSRFNPYSQRIDLSLFEPVALFLKESDDLYVNGIGLVLGSQIMKRLRKLHDRLMGLSLDPVTAAEYIDLLMAIGNLNPFPKSKDWSMTIGQIAESFAEVYASKIAKSTEGLKLRLTETHPVERQSAVFSLKSILLPSFAILSSQRAREIFALLRDALDTIWAVGKVLEERSGSLSTELQDALSQLDPVFINDCLERAASTGLVHIGAKNLSRDTGTDNDPRIDSSYHYSRRGENSRMVRLIETSETVYAVLEFLTRISAFRELSSIIPNLEVWANRHVTEHEHEAERDRAWISLVNARGPVELSDALSSIPWIDIEVMLDGFLDRYQLRNFPTDHLRRYIRAGNKGKFDAASFLLHAKLMFMVLLPTCLLRIVKQFDDSSAKRQQEVFDKFVKISRTYQRFDSKIITRIAAGIEVANHLHDPLCFGHIFNIFCDSFPAVSALTAANTASYFQRRFREASSHLQSVPLSDLCNDIATQFEEPLRSSVITYYSSIGLIVAKDYNPLRSVKSLIREYGIPARFARRDALLHDFLHYRELVGSRWEKENSRINAEAKLIVVAVLNGKLLGEKSVAKYLERAAAAKGWSTAKRVQVARRTVLAVRVIGHTPKWHLSDKDTLAHFGYQRDSKGLSRKKDEPPAFTSYPRWLTDLALTPKIVDDLTPDNLFDEERKLLMSVRHWVIPPKDAKRK